MSISKGDIRRKRSISRRKTRKKSNVKESKNKIHDYLK
jgi:hypothetical protein